jgi:F-type H+-transporting ATPase subunit epsilon
MNTFSLHLESSTQYERVEKVVGFVGEDESGSFGILPGHARMVTVLRFGLARFRVVRQDWEYVALPGAVVYFFDNQLHLSSRHYLRGKKFETISTALQEELRAEEEALREMKRSLSRLEEEMLKRLWELGRKVKASG